MRGVARRLLFRGLVALLGPDRLARRCHASLDLLRDLLLREGRRRFGGRRAGRVHERRRGLRAGGLLDGDAFFLLLGHAGFLVLRRAVHIKEGLPRRVGILRQTIGDEGVLEARRVVAFLTSVLLRLRDELPKDEIKRHKIIITGACNPFLLRAALVQELAIFGEALHPIGVCGQ